MRGLNLIDGVEGEGCVIYLTTVMILMGDEMYCVNVGPSGLNERDGGVGSLSTLVCHVTIWKIWDQGNI